MEQESTIFTDQKKSKNDASASIKHDDCTEIHKETMIKLGLKNVENIWPEWVLESNINETIYDQFLKNQFHY